MPCGNGTGPWWAQEKNWKCERTFGRGYSFRWQRVPIIKPDISTKDQQKSIESKNAEAQRQEAVVKQLEDDLIAAKAIVVADPEPVATTTPAPTTSTKKKTTTTTNSQPVKEEVITPPPAPTD